MAVVSRIDAQPDSGEWSRPARRLAGARARRRRARLVAYGFILPTIAFIAVFTYYPMVRALIAAFTNWDGFNAPTFIGIKNFTEVFNDPTFVASIVHVALWSAIGIPLALIPSFLAAELTFLVGKRVQYLYRTLLVIPMVLPGVVYYLIWQYVYSPTGLLNGLLRQLGLHGASQAWLANPHTALWALILMGFPWVVPFNYLIYYAGLQGMGTDVLDAAAIDGATIRRRILKVDIPLLIPQIKLLLILSVIQVSQNLLIPLVMTNGGPGTSTMTPILYMYQQAISYDRYGYGMAVAFVMFVVVMIMALVNFKFLQERR